MSNSPRKNIAILFGGRSAEHEISVITGLEVVDSLDTTKYQAVPVYIDAQGKWWTGDAVKNKEFYRNLPASHSDVKEGADVKEVALLPSPGVGGLVTRGSSGGGLSGLLGGKKEEVIPVDVFMPIFHGQFGEDGCIQGLFELADVAYTGAGVLASSVAMNKQACKGLLHSTGIPVLPSVVIHKERAQRDLAGVRNFIEQAEGLTSYPLFVKPMNLGSSVGVSRVENSVELDAALAKVFELDYLAIIEPCITDLLEINVSVMETTEGPKVSVVEVPVASGKVLTYEDKYMRGGGAKGSKGKGGSKSGSQRLSGMAGLTRVIDPEDLDEKYKSTVQNYALRAYQALESGGCVRFDFMVDTSKDQLYFNELNPIPGSMAFYLWEKTTPVVLYPQIINNLIETAVARRKMKAGLKREMGFKAMFS